MKELPYFKFFPNQWITGSIIFMDLDVQGAFMKICCYYWSKECNVTRDQVKTLVPHQWSKLLDSDLLKIEDDNIRIKWLDEQYKERLKEHKRNVSNGRKGGLSRAQALRKDNIRKDNIKKEEPYMSTNSIDEYLKEKQNANN